MTSRRRLKGRTSRPGFWLALMALLAYAYWLPRGALSNVDSHVALTRAIVDDHTLWIDRYAAHLADRARYHGHFYTDKAPGLSMLAVPAYILLRLVMPSAFFTPNLFFVVQYLLTVLVLSLPAALFVGVLWRYLASYVGRRRGALLAVGYAFGTMAWAFSVLLFSHMIAAMTLFGAFMLLHRPLLGKTRARSWRWIVSGVLCGLATGCEYPAGLVAFCLLLFSGYVAHVVTPRNALARPALFVAGAVLALLPVGAYNAAVYGSPVSQGYAHLGGDAQFIAGMRHGVEGIGVPSLAALWSITFSPYRGLFLLSPFLLLAVPGMALMWRRRAQRPALLVCAASVSAMLLFNSAYYFWDGGVSLGPRHFSPALPFLFFPIVFAVRYGPWNRLAPPLVALSVAIVGVYCTTVLICLPGVMNPFVDLALQRLVHGPAPNSWGILLGFRGAAALVPLAAMEALLGAVLWHSLRRPLAPRHAPRSAGVATDAA